MRQYVKAIAARAAGEPVVIETVVVPDSGPADAVVPSQAYGTLVAVGQYTKVEPSASRHGYRRGA